MALTAAELIAYLRLDKSGFERGLSGAEGQMRKTDSKFRDWAKGMGQATAEIITGGVAATSGLAAAVFATGVNYNTLQQQSRAALETIMGSAEAANAQMDKLDEFASNSPFAKDVFIKAQQQLLGFGQEADRVVPTLEAIQDAVAATGGSNEDIAELVRIIAQLEGGVKISAETLNQFGARGIDAAGLIGEAMGKTGDQIREDITAGSLDADEAIQALTDSMSDRFGGAAANVKETMAGAFDRVKAATRDIGAEMAAPFVDPNGGGKAVDWTNQFADALRAVQRQTGPFVEMMMRRYAPAFDQVSESLEGAKDIIDDFDMDDLDAALDSVSSYAPAIAGVAGALTTMGLTNIPIVGRLAQALGPIPAALLAAASASPEAREAMGDLWETAEPLVDTMGDVAVVAGGIFTEGIAMSAEALQLALDVIGPMVEGFRDLPEPVKTATGLLVAFAATRKIMPNFGAAWSEHVGRATRAVKGVQDQLRPWPGVLRGATTSAGDFRTAVGLIGTEVGTQAKRGVRGALGGLVSFLGGPWGIALGAATVALGFWAREHAQTRTRVEELADSLDRQSGAWTASTESLMASRLAAEYTRDELDELGLGYDDLVAVMRGGKPAYDELHQRLVDQHMANADVAEGTAGYSDELQRAQSEASNTLGPLSELGVELRDAEQKNKDLRDSTDAANESMALGEQTQRDFAEAVGIAADNTKTMDERIRGLKDALDALNGVQKSAEEAARDLHDSHQSLSEFIGNLAEENDGLAKGLWDTEAGMVAISDEGNRLNEMLETHTDDMLAAALAAYDKAGGDENAAEAAAAASEAYGGQVEKLREVLTESGMAEEEVDALIATMKRTPEEIAFIVSSGGTISDTDAALLDLAATIRETPDKNVNITDTTPEVRQRLKDMGFEIRNLDNGEVVVVTKGTKEAAQKIRDDVVNQDYTATITLKTSILGNTRQKIQEKALEEARKGGQGWGIVAPEGGGRYHGGIDVFRGMANGAVTPPSASVMDVAQFVAPGDIRFAGDRSDVPEAWIPLDGSRRSINILEEAMRRMPNFEVPTATGMAAGGITGEVVPPQVEAASAPDTSELEDTWAAAMQSLEESTRGSFDTIQDDTAAAQAATTAATRAQMSTMADVTTANLGEMSSVTAAQMAAMTSATASNMAAMESSTASETTQMRTRAAAEFSTLTRAGTDQSARLAAQTAAHMAGMRADSVSEASTMRSQTGQQFSDMEDAGTTAARNLRTGLVSELSQARSPFTGNVNDLVDVMRSFSESLNSAYGDMGVSVGKPSRVAFASGGILPGYSPGRDIHRFYSPTAGQVDLSGGEAIMRPEVTRAMGSSWVHSLNAAARTRGVAGVRQIMGRNQPRQAFADGGIIGSFMEPAQTAATEHKGRLPSNWLRPTGSSTIDQVLAGLESHLEEMMTASGAWVRPTTGRVTSRYGERRGAYPHSGMDIAERHGTEVVAAAPGRVVDTGTNIGPGRTGEGILLEHLGRMFSYYGHNPRGGIKVSPGQMVLAGQPIGAQGNTGNSTGAHLHWEIHRNRAWADINPHPFWDAAGAGSSLVAFGTSGGSDRWAPVIRAALMRNGLPVTDAYVSAWLRQVQTESGGNPNARQRVNDINMRLGRPAEGLLQVIPPTFRAHMHPGHSNPFNPLDNALAAIAYAKARYGTTGMLSAIGQGRGYRNGVMSATPGWHMVGEAGPELVRFKGGETVRNNARSRSLVASQRLTRAEADMLGRAIARHGGLNGGLHLHGPVTRDTDELMRTAAEVAQDQIYRDLGI